VKYVESRYDLLLEGQQKMIDQLFPNHDWSSIIVIQSGRMIAAAHVEGGSGVNSRGVLIDANANGKVGCLGISRSALLKLKESNEDLAG
jgi:hypothetical protein